MTTEGPSSPTLGRPGDIESRADLAQALTALRVRSGLTIRELARRVDVPSATAGGYFSGRHLPGPAHLELFSAMLRECGVAEGELGGWIDALMRVRVGSDGRLGRLPAPYRGLEPFQATDAELFFGREAVTEDVLARLRQLRADPAGNGSGSRLLVVLGPSGSGKSSLLGAGVTPRVQDGALSTDGADWSVSLITPGDVPVEALRACQAGPRGPGRLIVVDQLEEVFSVASSERGRFFEELVEMCGRETLVVAGLRTDFFEAALGEPVLLTALGSGDHVLLGPMTGDEVRRAITEPARRAGVHVEEGLVEVLLSDLAPGSPAGFAHQAGALPLLSHALLATWERAKRNQLTLADYRDAGGLHGAVRQSAEDLYTQLRPDEQELARRIFCRLVRLQDDAPLTRRTVAREELEELAVSYRDGRSREELDALPAEVLDRFVAVRLVTVDAGTVELTHEALLTAWPRLAGWLERDRERLRLHHQLTDAANAWMDADRDASLLLRGTRLQAVLEWVEDSGPRGGLNRAEHEFLDASAAVAEAERRAARIRTRRMQQLLGLVAVFAVAALVLAIVAFRAQHSANQARDQALSRQVAIEASQLEPSDPALAMQLALAAYRISPTTQATSTLLDASASEMPTRLLGAIGPTSAALSATGSELAVSHSATNQVSLYRLSDGHPTLLATVATGPSSSQLFTVALSPDGQLLAAGGTNRQVVLWSLDTPAHPVKLATLGGFTGTVYGVTFSPDGRSLAAADNDGTVRAWSLATPSEPLREGVLAAPGRPSLQAVAYSPDGRTLAAVGAGGHVIVWPAGGGRPLTALTATASNLTSVAYSPDGLTLAAGAQSGQVYLWRTSPAGALRTAHPPLGGFTNWVDSLAFSPNGQYLAAGSSDSTLRIWSTTGWAHVATLTHPAPVTGILFTPNGEHLITVDEDGTTRIWSFPPPAAVSEPGNVYTIDYTASGDELAAVSGGPQGDVDLWDVADPWLPTHISAVVMPRSFGPAAGVEALSPDGKLLAVGSLNAKVRLVDLSDPRHPRLVGGLLGGATPLIEQLNFSPNMKQMSVGDDSGRIHLWNISDPAHPVEITTLNADGNASQVLGVAYSTNSKLLAVACANGKIGLWDVAAPDAPKRLAVLKGFASYAYTVAFTPNDRTLIAGSADNTVRLWDISNPAQPRLLGPPLTGPSSTIYQVAVSPDGRTLAAATTDQDVWLWNIDNPGHPVEIADLKAASGQVFDVTFSPNDDTLVASGGDQTLHFWNYHPTQVATRVCALAGDTITRAEWSQYIQGAAYHPPCR